LTSVIAAIFVGLYFKFTRNVNFWQKLGIPYVKPTPFVGNIKNCVLLKTTIGEQLQKIYNEHSDKPYVGIFSFSKPSLSIRDPELVKNIMVKDFQNFMDPIVLFNEKLDPLIGNSLPVLKGQIWLHLRTNFSQVFTSRKMKMMFYLVDTCGKELTDYLEKAAADGNLPQDQFCYKMYRKFKFQNLDKFKGYMYVCMYVCSYVCMYECMNICMYVYNYIYIYIYNENVHFHPTVQSEFS